MITVNGNEYSICLFDTNALSNLLKNPEKWINQFHNTFDIGKTIIGYSIFSLSEIWFKSTLFEKYLDFFSRFPSVILDGYESIFIKEIENYFIQNQINPIVIAPFAINESGMTQREKLVYVIEKSSFITKTEYWKKSQNEILTSIINLKEKYPPKNGTYSKKDIEFFCFSVGTSQICLRNFLFAKSLLESNNAIDLERFPSIKTLAYVVFYKIYPDNRKPEPSDVFDIIISSLLPYVDYFITERNLNHIVNQIQKKHKFLTNVKCFTMKQIINTQSFN